jgi:nitrogen fixation-related uncharacterized protein
MALIYVFIFGSILVFGLTAVAGLVWAVRTGQLRDFGVGATSIFDDDEPVGVMTDTFPDTERQTTTNAIQEGRDREQRG